MSARHIACFLAFIPACTPTPQPPKPAAKTQTTVPMASATPAATPASSVPDKGAPPASETAPDSSPPPEELTAYEAKLSVAPDVFVSVHWTPGEPDVSPTLSITRLEHGKTVLRRLGWKEITQFDWKNLHPCENVSTNIVHDSLGAPDVVRISLVCRTGEDYFTSSEIAIFVHSTTLDVVWAGLADRLDSSMDSCVSSRHVTFSTPSPDAIEKKITTITRWVDQHIDEQVKAQLKRECKVGTDIRIERESRRKSR